MKRIKLPQHYTIEFVGSAELCEAAGPSAWQRVWGKLISLNSDRHLLLFRIHARNGVTGKLAHEI